jgi:hypothetical protein
MSSKIDLLGWDTVFGISYENVNKAIVKSNSTPASFNFQKADTTVSGEWLPWQVTMGGDGQNIQMLCSIKSGDVASQGKNYALTEASLVIQLRLDKLPDPSYPAPDKTGKGGEVYILKVTSSGTVDNPAVSVISSDFPTIPKGLLKKALPQMFQEYLNDTISEFNHVFAAVNLNVIADKGDYQWIKPTSTAYACAPSHDESLEKSIFAVLCTTDDKPSGLLQNGVDARLLENLTKGANSAFAINSTKVLQHIFMPGVVYNIQGSSADDFYITNDDHWIVNKNELVWGNFKLDNDNTIQPKIAAGNFQMGIEGNQAVIKIVNATCPWTGWHGPGEIDLHLNLTQYFELELKKSDKGWVLIPKPDHTKQDGTVVSNGSTSIVCNVTVSSGVQVFEICTGIAASIVGSVLGAVIGAAFDAAGLVATKSATEGVVTLTEAEITRAIAITSEDEIIAAERVAIRSAAVAVENAEEKTFAQSFKSAISANKWKVFAGILGSVMGAQIGLISKYMQMAAKGDLSKIPTFDNFAANCVGATTFPGNTGWDLKNAGLNGPLIIEGDLKSADGDEVDQGTKASKEVEQSTK